MTPVWHQAPQKAPTDRRGVRSVELADAATEIWRRPTGFWHALPFAAAEDRPTMNSRRGGWGKPAVAVGLLVALAALASLWWGGRPADPPVEVGVFESASSDTGWSNFVAGVRAAAAERGMTARLGDEEDVVTVDAGARRVAFRWYPELGSRGMQRRVREVCAAPAPPVAVVGASNSSLSLALAEQLADCGPDAPLLLLSTGTADHITGIHEGRTFRFGYRNAYQARTVVARLAQYDREQAVPEASEPAVILTQIEDNPFAVDLARDFERELDERLEPTFVAAPEEFRHGGGTIGGVEPPTPGRTWTLSTSAGGYDQPRPEEERFADAAVAAMVADPDRPWVLVLPVGSTPFRRISFALDHAMRSAGDRAKAERARRNLVVLSGDSMGYHTFRESRRNQLLPDEIPAPVIFFDHVDPIDAPLAARLEEGTPARNVPNIGLDRDIAGAVLDVLAEADVPATPAALADGLRRLTEDGRPMFARGERSGGGGATVAIPQADRGSFELRLPARWQ